MPELSVVLVNWNTGPLLRKCLDALPEALAGSEAEVLVVDNASTDQSIARAEGSLQSFRLFAMRSNLGFARANNIGIRQASGDVIVLLNPDTEPRPGSLRLLADFLRRHPRAAAVGPKLRHPDGTLQPSCRRFPTTLTFAFLFLKLHHLFPQAAPLRRYFMAEFSSEEETMVDQIMGACMAIPRRMLDRVGLLDEQYWIWFEEVDWCRRARLKGAEIWFTPAAEVVHHGGASFQRVLPIQKEWWFLESSLRYAARHLGLLAVAALLPLVPIALLLDTPLFLPWLRRLSSRRLSRPS